LITFGSRWICSRRAFGDLAAVVEDADVVRDIHHHAHVVLDQQDGDAFVARQVFEEFVEFGRFAWVEAGRRFVEAEQERVNTECAGDLDAPLHAVGQVAGGGVCLVDQMEVFAASRPPCPSLPLSARR
jgi:hypothetical protein